jgi:metallo-beta-lactamase class B
MTIKIQAILILMLGISNAASAQEKTADQYTMAEKIEMGVPYHKELAAPVEPFRVLGNIYSVGSKNIGIYLITTEQGHILIDTGVTELHEQIKANVRKLGFKVEDIKILLATHAHFDHVQGHEAMRAVTNAQVMAIEGDAEALRLGEDISPLGAEGWEPVKNVKILQHGDQIKLGASELTAHAIPGHTQGCTVWTLNVEDAGEKIDVAIFGCRGPNGIVEVNHNDQFPDLIEQTLLGFKRLQQIKPDLYLSNHPQTDFETFGAAMRAGKRPHPMLQQTPWQEMVTNLEVSFKGRVKN